MGQEDNLFNLFDYANNHFREIVRRELMIYSAQVLVESAVPYHPEEKKLQPERIERLQDLLWRADPSKFRYAAMQEVLATAVFHDGDMVDFLHSLVAQFRAVLTQPTYESLVKDHLMGMYTACTSSKPLSSQRNLRLGPQQLWDGFDRPENREPDVLLVNDWLVMLILLRFNLDLIFELFAEQQKAKQAIATPTSRRGTTA